MKIDQGKYGCEAKNKLSSEKKNNNNGNFSSKLRKFSVILKIFIIEDYIFYTFSTRFHRIKKMLIAHIMEIMKKWHLITFVFFLFTQRKKLMKKI